MQCLLARATNAYVKQGNPVHMISIPSVLHDFAKKQDSSSEENLHLLECGPTLGRLVFWRTPFAACGASFWRLQKEVAAMGSKISQLLQGPGVAAARRRRPEFGRRVPGSSSVDGVEADAPAALGLRSRTSHGSMEFLRQLSIVLYCFLFGA